LIIEIIVDLAYQVCQVVRIVMIVWNVEIVELLGPSEITKPKTSHGINLSGWFGSFRQGEALLRVNEHLRLLKNDHLLRFPHPSSLRRTLKYASFLRISRALHLGIFEQPEQNYFSAALEDKG
jgi:hypothetical protein